MQTNRLTVRINKPIQQVFEFAITPPNTTRWIDGIVSEETNEWPVRIGTVYKLTDKQDHSFEVTVTSFKKNELVEWVSQDHNYHCHYTFREIDEKQTELEYLEWVDTGELDEPFTQTHLEKLKMILES